MIQFKVVKASKLLLLAAVCILAAVAAFILFRWTSTGAQDTDKPAASLVSTACDEPESRAAFSPSQDAIEIEVVGAPSAAPAIEASGRSILIYHTHTHEAYEQVSDDPYEAVEAWRTTDAVHSVVRVGEALADALRACGFDVTHDTTDHESDALSTAYTRSLETLQGYDRPFDLYIDLHRDAYASGTQLRFETGDGTRCAQPMLLIGNGAGFDEKPFYAQNLAFAQALTDRVNALQPGLCKEVLVKDGRYNQHIGVFSVLIEVGHNRNTLGEALNTTSFLADAIADLMILHPDPELEAMRADAIKAS